MKNWLFPATVLGLSGLGLLFASERGRGRVRDFVDRLLEHGDPLGEFSKFVDEQLDAMQTALDSVAAALEQPQS
ncbi:MAG TPA: hypothetical protein VJN64_10220 [Terriglobales bacterium]|nr:hypothetical protein [Terriglobales bacterium]